MEIMIQQTYAANPEDSFAGNREGAGKLLTENIGGT